MLKKYFRTNIIAVVIASLFSISVVSQAAADGITWTSRTTEVANDWRSVAYGNGLWVAVSFLEDEDDDDVIADNNQVMTSPDGITWTSRTPAENNQWASVAYGDGLWVAVSIGGDNRVMTSAGVIVTTAAANAEAARVAAANAEAARVAAANAEAARKAKEQRELTEILALIPSIGELTLSLGEITKSLYSTKCVKGKKTKYVKKGSKCPKGYVKKK